MSAERRPGPSRFEPSLRRLLLRLRLCLLLHPNEPLANLTLAPSLTLSLTLALTLTLALAKPPPASVFPKQHRLSFGRASPEAFQPSRVKLSPSRSGRGQRPPTSQPLHRHPKEKACAVIANEVPTEPLRSRERRREHHSPVPPPEPANAHTVSAPSVLRPQAPLENRQLIDLMSLRLTRNSTRSCGRTVREGHARASSATTPNTKTDPAMVERTLPPTSNNRKQGKRLGTKPRTVQTGGVGASYRCVFWIRLDL